MFSRIGRQFLGLFGPDDFCAHESDPRLTESMLEGLKGLSKWKKIGVGKLNVGEVMEFAGEHGGQGLDWFLKFTGLGQYGWA